MASVFDSLSSEEPPPMPNPDSPSKTRHENPQTPMDVNVEEEEEEEELKPGSNSETEIKKTEVVEDGQKSPKSRGRPKNKKKKKEKPKQPTNPRTESIYSCPFQHEAGEMFAPSDLVWGKVRSHPWWPGLIVDPADASELALKHRNKNNLLVAYFFDNTFAWNDPSVLRPFRSDFSRMTKRSGTDRFISAVGEALAEVSRRVGCALICGCYDKGEKNSAEVKFENTGVRTGTAVPSGDVMFVRNLFDPVEFVRFLCELGRNPNVGFPSLDLVVAKSQLGAFNRSRGCSSQLPEFDFSFAFAEEEILTPVTSHRIYTRKLKSVDGESGEKPVLKKSVPEEGMKKRTLSEIFNKEVLIARTPVKKPSRVRVGGPSGSDSSGRTKKRSLDSLGDLGTKSKVRRKYLRVSQCMRKTEITPKPNGVTSRKRKRLSMIKDRIENEDRLSGGKNGREKKGILKGREIDVDEYRLEDFISSSEMFSRLRLVAQVPLQGCSFEINAMVISFLTRFRDHVVDPSTSIRTLVQDDDDNDDDDDDEKLITLRQKKQKSRKGGHKEDILEGISVTPFSNQSKDSGKNEKQGTNLRISEISDTDGHKKLLPEKENSAEAVFTNAGELEDDDDVDDDDDDDDNDEKLITLHRQRKQKSGNAHKEDILEGISATNQSEDLGKNEKQENDSGVSPEKENGAEAGSRAPGSTSKAGSRAPGSPSKDVQTPIKAAC